MGARLLYEDPDTVFLRPQPGPQTIFLSTPADVAFYGGAAGAGKTRALLMEPTRWTWVPTFSAVIFRRTTTQIRNPGAMWDESSKVYRPLQTRARQDYLEHHFESGAVVKFASMEHEKNKYDWDGAQIPLIAFDQLEHFTSTMFFYMLSRNRSDCGVAPYMRATCNPDPDSWLAEFIAWWIDQETGFPIPERAGVIRWFIRVDESVVWADSKAELEEKYGAECMPLSFTFIPGTIYDNKELLRVDPGYLAKLKAMNRVERERLLGGNWKIRAVAGLLFQRTWCETVDVAPADTRWVRGWDLAATERTPMNDPDWTVGIKLGFSPSTRKYYLANAVRAQYSPGKVKTLMRNMATSDGRECLIFVKQDPGQAGKAQFSDLISHLDGFAVNGTVVTGDKITNFNPFSSQAEHGNVCIVRGFNTATLHSLEGFPDAKHDDDADAISAAYEGLQHFKVPMKINPAVLARA
jgi:predicted phage terminase large subunit-like protein